MSFNKLTPEEKYIIEEKGTEPPFSGKYNDYYHDGVYICKRCNNPLFSSKAKFDAGCGWPSFDDTFKAALNTLPDVDGKRVEIQCANCHAHLGHVFSGENFTEKNTRHCVNSLSLKFIPSDEDMPDVITPPKKPLPRKSP